MSDWQPIETAPKGPFIIGYIVYAEWEASDGYPERQMNPFVATIYWAFDEWNLEPDWRGMVTRIQPTHWMPLHVPPLQQEQTGET